MREPDWMFASVVVLGFIAIALACVYESTYDARYCASDDARRAGVGLWHLSCLISAVPVLFILTGSVTEAFELKDERVEVEESVQIAALDGKATSQDISVGIRSWAPAVRAVKSRKTMLIR